ncbi:hypothetical protein Lepto1489_23290 (plasmid) [Leptospira interrogans serovar Bataviae]|uniref:Uncharacterized protein n=1 Tax=Leptospira interrogans serovar Bataviae TaxID=312175 RepID=A0AAP9WPP0_LEPIR|nr:hypothetical protein Lepto1489_23290 [Leptospira interrogans serovar Bataviae]
MTKTRLYSFCILILLLGNCKKDPSSLPNYHWPVSDLEKNQILLSIGQWNSSNGIYIEFLAENRISYHEESEPVRSGKGVYSIKENKLNLQFKETYGEESYEHEFDCIFGFEESNYSPQQYIECPQSIMSSRPVKIYNKKSINPPGTTAFIENEKILTMGNILGTINFDSFFRSKPDLNSKEISFNDLAPEECLEGLSKSPKQVRLPKGFKIIIIGKTEKLSKIENWNSPWYYIETSINCYGEIHRSNGWVYGQFVDLE